MRDKSNQIKGECFVVANKEGLVWNGETWVEVWSEGMQFSAPGSAYEDCEAVIKQVEVLSGVKGYCCFIPRGANPKMKLGPVRGFDDFPPVTAHRAPPPDGASAT